MFVYVHACVCTHCREISVEKLNLDSDSSPKAEIGGDVVDVPAPLVSERVREMEAKEEGKQTEDFQTGERWASLHYHVTILLTSYLKPLAWKQCSSHRSLHCVLQ